MSPEIIRIAEQLQAHVPVEIPEESGIGWASVAAIFRPAPAGPELLFIERARHEADPWSGHMAFPGGRRDPEDPAIITTAVRETREELALDLLRHGQILGQLDDVQAIGRGRRLPLVIRPFVFHLPEPQPLTPNDEVATTVWVPLGWLADAANVSSFPYDHQGQQLTFPCYDFRGHRIWGLTFAMVQSLLTVLQPSPLAGS